MKYKILIIVIFIWLAGLTAWIIETQFVTLDRDIKQLQLIKNQQETIILLQKSIIVVQKETLENSISINAIGDDYPPKMLLGQRSWCLNRSCINE